MKNLIIFITSILALGLTACDEGSSSSGRRNQVVNGQFLNSQYINNQNPYVSSPRGSYCIYDGFQYVETFQTGYTTTSTYTYRHNFNPFNTYLPSGRYNSRYRDPYYARNVGCNDMNALIQQRGYFAFRGDFRININVGCPPGTVPQGFSWGMVCSDPLIVRVNNRRSNRPRNFHGRRGQQCHVLTDTHCNCRPITHMLGTNPAQSGICW